MSHECGNGFGLKALWREPRQEEDAEHREAPYSQQKPDWELTVAQIMNSLLPNSDLS